MTTSRITAFIACIALSALVHAAEPGHWPHYRGPAMTGHAAADAKPPVEWTAKNVVWKVPVKGVGQSTPVIWGDRIYLTSALDGGGKRLVMALDRESGKLLWEQTAWSGSAEPSHAMNGWASPSVTTDGQHVWAWFGKGGAHCYTIDGKHVWSQQLGEFKIKTGRGTGSSLLLAGDVLIVNGDSESDPYLFGLEKATGKTIWRADRERTEGYSTPILTTVNGRQEVVLNGHSYVAAYDPKTGKQLWQCSSYAGRGEPVPAVGADGTLYLVNGLAGDVYAVKPGGEGDVSKSHRLWHTQRNEGRDLPSPVLIGEHLLVANMGGMLTSYDAKSGKELSKVRIGTGKMSATPTVAGGKAYFIFENGETVVVEPGATPKVAGKGVVGPAGGEIFRASPVAVGKRLYIRSDKVLYCVE